jgi:hypothetical protein
MQMIEDLLRDVIASTKGGESDLRHEAELKALTRQRLFQIREDCKVIYHLLERINKIDSQTAEIFNYANLLQKMRE